VAACVAGQTRAFISRHCRERRCVPAQLHTTLFSSLTQLLSNTQLTSSPPACLILFVLAGEERCSSPRYPGRSVHLMPRDERRVVLPRTTQQSLQHLCVVASRHTTPNTHHPTHCVAVIVDVRLPATRAMDLLLAVSVQPLQWFLRRT
jgi:hypothetical protein